jgi:hypothetical protein
VSRSNLGNHHRNAVQAGFRQGAVKRGAIRSPSAFYFGELRSDPPVATIEILGGQPVRSLRCDFRVCAKPRWSSSRKTARSCDQAAGRDH